MIKTKLNIEEAIELYNSGKTYRYIASIYGVTYQRVHQLLQGKVNHRFKWTYEGSESEEIVIRLIDGFTPFSAIESITRLPGKDIVNIAYKHKYKRKLNKIIEFYDVVNPAYKLYQDGLGTNQISSLMGYRINTTTFHKYGLPTLDRKFNLKSQEEREKIIHELVKQKSECEGCSK